jgi:hypothetical protein
MYKYIYTITFIISLYLFFRNFKKIYKYEGWFYKTLLLMVTGAIGLYSLFYDNITINTMILPILLILNIVILFFITFRNKYTLINLIPIIGLLYILCIFKINDFNFSKGELIKPNKQWIYLQIIALSVYYLLSNKSAFDSNDKIGCVLLLLYPLLFPLNEYFIHRIFSLCLMVQFAWLYNI